MIYLFNSGYRARHVRNVLNTLFLPQGCTNEYNYSARGERLQIALEMYEDFLGRKNDEVAIIYINRFGDDGYEYYPLRLGKLVRTRPQDDRLYFRVELGEFVFPHQVDTFNVQIKRSLLPMRLPCLTNSDPLEVKDGYYAIIAGSLFTHHDDYMHGESAWTRAVDSLRTFRAFEDSDEQQFIFVKCELHKQSTQGDSLKPQRQNDDAIFDLLKSTRYGLQLTYRYPTQITNTEATAKIEAKLGENLLPPGSVFVNVDAHANSTTLPFSTKRYLEDHESGMNFSFISSAPNVELFGPDRPLLFRIRESKGFWIQIGLALLAFSILGVVIGTDFSKVSPLTVSGILDALWLKVSAGLLQAIVLFWIFKLVGKKLL